MNAARLLLTLTALLFSTLPGLARGRPRTLHLLHGPRRSGLRRLSREAASQAKKDSPNGTSATVSELLSGS